MTPSRSRLPGILVMGVVFVGALVWWRGCDPAPSSLAGKPSPPANEPRERGGQVIASLRAEPRTFNRLASSDQTTETLAMLMQGRLVRVNRSTFELEPWLAERWESNARRAHSYAAPAPGRRLVRRSAIYVRRRPLFSARRLRPERQERRGQQPHDRRAANRCDGAGRFNRRPDIPVSFRPGSSPARHAADPSEAQAGIGSVFWQVCAGVGVVDRARTRSWARARSSFASISPVSVSSSIGIPGIGGRRRTVRRFPI